MSTICAAQALLIEGPDAVAFAHAQFASDVRALPIGAWQFSAWLNAQGRVRALCHLARLDEERLLLLWRGGEAEALGEALRRYVFRSKVTITTAPWRTLSTGTALALHATRIASDAVMLGCGMHSLRIAATGQGDAAWRLPQLEAGWPWLPAAALDTLLPSALSLHRLQAVAIDKGCYPGQEIVARMHWRGGHKRHLCHVRLTHDTSLDPSLRYEGHEVGTLLEVVAHDGDLHALVVLNDEITSTLAENAIVRLDGEVSLRLQQRWDN